MNKREESSENLTRSALKFTHKCKRVSGIIHSCRMLCTQPFTDILETCASQNVKVQSLQAQQLISTGPVAGS